MEIDLEQISSHPIWLCKTWIDFGNANDGSKATSSNSPASPAPNKQQLPSDCEDSVVLKRPAFRIGKNIWKNPCIYLATSLPPRLITGYTSSNPIRLFSRTENTWARNSTPFVGASFSSERCGWLRKTISQPRRAAWRVFFGSQNNRSTATNQTTSWS